MQYQAFNSVGNYNYNSKIYRCGGYPSHFHKNHELIYVFSGILHVKVNTEEMTLSAGEAIFIFGNNIHSFYSTDENIFWVGVFSCDYISLFSLEHHDGIMSCFSVGKYKDFLTENLFTENKKSVYCLISALNLVCDLCTANVKSAENERIGALKNAILTYIFKNFMDDITLKSLSDFLGYEQHYISRRFHDIFGMNFREMLNIYRFEKACSLFNEGKTDITSVALESGFQNVRNFNRVFKKFTGITPSSYAKSPETTFLDPKFEQISRRG